MNYVPVPSASLRAKPPLPSASMPPAPAAQELPSYEDDLVEEHETPALGTPQGGFQASPPASQRHPAPFPGSDWQPQVHTQPPPQPQPLATGPYQPLQSSQLPPPSQRHFAPPPSHPSVGPISAPVPMAMPPAASSARVRQVTPMDLPSYSGYPSSQEGPASQQITGPQMPIPPVHPNTGSFPTVAGPASRPGAAADDAIPLGYVVASAFLLAIALVGFGLYLAFEVISL